VYYTYIPSRNQISIPIFDTTVNTLSYDQLFNYNRFSGIDRIGDANQIGVGITTRLIEQQSGLEKVRLGVGEIAYFANRNVTLCNNNTCTDNPQNHSNFQRLSPLSGVLDYHVNPLWKFTANSIWNPVSKQIDNSTLGLHYQPDGVRIINIGYSYVFNGDIQSGSVVNSAQNNLKLTDFSVAWPLTHDVSMVGRWSEDWNLSRLQNLLGGVQYDTCCWALRMVGGRAFTQLQNNTPQYNNEFYIQFALKGLGNIGSGNPTGLLSSINGYNTQFGQEL
jgi:LPS-assembly protein